MSTTILVVEDDAMIRLGLASLLIDEGYDVVEAASGDEAREILDRGDDLNLVVTDYDMPGALDGAELAQWIGENRPEIAVIVVSGAASRNAIPLPPGTPFLSKPYQEHEILSVIETSIRGSVAKQSK